MKRDKKSLLIRFQLFTLTTLINAPFSLYLLPRHFNTTELFLEYFTTTTFTTARCSSVLTFTALTAALFPGVGLLIFTCSYDCSLFLSTLNSLHLRLQFVGFVFVFRRWSHRLG